MSEQREHDLLYDDLVRLANIRLREAWNTLLVFENHKSVFVVLTGRLIDAVGSKHAGEPAVSKVE